MANIATGFLGALTSLGNTVGSAIAGLAPIVSAVAPVLAPALAARIAPRARNTIYTADPMYQTAVMPGGALVPNYPTGAGALSLVPSLTSVGVQAPVGPDTGFLDTLSQSTGIGSGSRLPRTVEGRDARGRTRVYVLAPMVRYRVSITRAGRRRCSGGR